MMSANSRRRKERREKKRQRAIKNNKRLLDLMLNGPPAKAGTSKVGLRGLARNLKEQEKAEAEKKPKTFGGFPIFAGAYELGRKTAEAKERAILEMAEAKERAILEAIFK